MAKKLLTRYEFNASAKTITINNNYALNQILMVTNVTDNIIIYNFAVPDKGGSVTYDSNNDTTTISLLHDTTSMSDIDELQIYVDVGVTQIEPFGAYSDPVDKMRVSNPESLIDTDFEYSLQPTKWETVTLQNNIPGIYQKANEPAFTAEQIISIIPETIVSTPLVNPNFTYETDLESGTWINIRNRGNSADRDSTVSPVMPFSYTVAGYTFNRVYMNSEGVMIFGTSGTTSEVNLGSPTYWTRTPFLNIYGAEMRVVRYDYRIDGTAPNRRYIIRYWGNSDAQTSGSVASMRAYVIFNEGQNKIEVHYESNDGTEVTSGGISNGSEFIAQWTINENSVSPWLVRQGVIIDLNTVELNGITVTVDQAPVEPFYVGQPIIFKETNDTLNLDRGFLITQVVSTTKFFIVPNQDAAIVGEQSNDYTIIYTGGFYFSAEIPYSTVESISGTRNIKITFSSPHGLYVGSKIYVVDQGTLSTDWIGAFTISKVLSNTEVEYTALTNDNYLSSEVLSTGSTLVYARNDGTAQHRFFDGGVQINPEAFSPNSQIIRQTRNYFRYQSGKGLQFSTGVLFKPTYDVLNVSVSADSYEAGVNEKYLMTIETEQLHGFVLPDEYREGVSVKLYNFEVDQGTNPYNIEGSIFSVVDSKSFTIEIPVNPASLPTDLLPGGLQKVEVLTWRDATVRTGMFDDQNGLFLEHDGTDLYAVRRNSTEQISGFSAIIAGSSTLTGTGTKYKTQLNEGDYIVIKGKSYFIVSIDSDTSLVLSPEYNGVTVTRTKIVKTNEIRIPQQDFNLDVLDGSGPSKYIFNSSKMQMVFIDYSWYGAGKIRYGMRGIDGKVYYFHEIVNNNVNTEAYMRSGNLPGRFEIKTKSKTGKLKSELTAISTTLDLDEIEASYIQQKGRIIVNNEYIEYTKGSTAGGLTSINLDNRNIYGLTAGNTTGDINDGWISYNQNCSPSLSHWGVSVIMDGRFDSDKSYLFSAINTGAISVAAAQTRALLSIRLAPSVDYGIPGFYGVRNLINRSLLTLSQVGVVTSGQMTIELRINGNSVLFETDSNWTPAGNGSIAQYLNHTTPTAVSGGDLVAQFLTDEGSNRAASTTFDITSIRGLSNSILGGPNTYPDGPDTLTVYAINNGTTTANIRARISWQESQG